MIVLLGIILVLRVDCRSFIQDLSETAMFPQVNPNYIIRSNSMDKIKEEYDSYVDLKDNDADSNEFDILSEEERFFSNGHQFGTDRDRQLIQTYILVKTMRQRNKRFTSYLQGLLSQGEYLNIGYCPSSARTTLVLSLTTITSGYTLGAGFTMSGYSSDLTFCHFKICNIGKKRRPRFIHGMKSSNENVRELL